MTEELAQLDVHLTNLKKYADSLSIEHDIVSLDDPGYVLFAVAADGSGFVFYDYLCDCGCGDDKRGVLRIAHKRDNNLAQVFYGPGFYRVPYINHPKSERR